MSTSLPKIIPYHPNAVNHASPAPLYPRREPPPPPRGIVERESTNAYPHAPSWFADALAFIRANVAKGISASDVFRHVGFSRTLVEDVFRKSGSASVQKLIAQTRIDEAKRLLDTTSLPVKEVAALSGFSTLEYLSRAFAAATGLSPSGWRERSVRNA